MGKEISGSSFSAMGLEITYACIELIAENAPKGDRTAIDELKAAITVYAKDCEEEIDHVALNILVAVFSNWAKLYNENSNLKLEVETYSPEKT